MAWNIGIKFHVFIQRFCLCLFAKQNLTDLKDGKVTEMLARPPGDFYAFKNMCIEMLLLRPDSDH